MLRFCAVTLPIWFRVLERHLCTKTIAYADDAYVHGKLKDPILAAADLKRSFKNDAALQMQVCKFKIYIKEFLSNVHANLWAP